MYTNFRWGRISRNLTRLLARNRQFANLLSAGKLDFLEV